MMKLKSGPVTYDDDAKLSDHLVYDNISVALKSPPDNDSDFGVASKLSLLSVYKLSSAWSSIF